MELTVIDKDAEDMLYAFLIAEEHRLSIGDRKIKNTQVLQCRFFYIGKSASSSGLQTILEEFRSDAEATLYLCGDGDAILRWDDGEPDLRNNLVKCLTEAFKTDFAPYVDTSEFFIDYDMIDGRNRLKAECSRKLKKQTRQSRELAKYFSNTALIDALRKTILLTKMQRMMRTKPHILIVEDQKFSQKILASILKDYTCHIAENAGEALLMYMEKCPDIVFLDIELPDLSGHIFAKFINGIDDDSYVVIASGSQYEQDVKTARENNAKGFVVKPYDRTAILKMIDQYAKTRKKSWQKISTSST